MRPDTDILGLIDVQPTFMPRGELPVAEGHAVVPVINRLLRYFRHAFATQDWHPPGHSSFASTHVGKTPFDVLDGQTLWPDHGLAGSPNAEIHAAIDTTKIEVVIRKGFRPHLDSYSAFFENDRTTATGLDGWLRQRGFKRIFFTGLATDFCVGWSAEDALRLGYEAVLIEDACRGIGIPTTPSRTTIDDMKDKLSTLGCRFVTSTGLAV
jgi:nicotinamidase/pyrazinamidase